MLRNIGIQFYTNINIHYVIKTINISLFFITKEWHSIIFKATFH